MDRESLFSVPIADLEYGEQELHDEIPIEWLAKALEGTEAKPRGSPGRLDVTLMKNGREVMVRGRARASVVVPCARTLDPVDTELDANVFLLLGPAAGAPSGGGGRAGGRGRAAARPESPSPGRTKKPAGGRKPRQDDDVEPAEAAQDTYAGDRIVLDDFVREFLLLELPMFPLREDLRSGSTPAIDGPESGASEAGEPARKTVDPRLAPLAALKSRLRDKKE